MDEGDTVNVSVEISHSIVRAECWMNNILIDAISIDNDRIWLTVENASLGQNGSYEIRAWDILNQTCQVTMEIHVRSIRKPVFQRDVQRGNIRMLQACGLSTVIMGQSQTPRTPLSNVNSKAKILRFSGTTQHGKPSSINRNTSLSTARCTCMQLRSFSRSLELSTSVLTRSK